MENEDYDEDIYEETKSKVVYKRRSSASEVKTDEEDHEKSRMGRSDHYKRKDSRSGRPDYSKREESRTRQPEFSSHEDSPVGRREYSKRESSDDEKKWTTTATINFKGKDGKRISQVGQRTSKEESPTRRWSTSEKHDVQSDPQTEWTRTVIRESRSATDLHSGSRHSRKSDSKFHISPKVEKDRRGRAERGKRYPYDEDSLPSRSKSRLSKTGFYYPVDKWEVDYTNKNYVRSKCVKPQGLHRYVYGRPFHWDIDYDNRYYLVSKVNVPRGLHRQGREFKRKLVPDDDILADSTGWQFEYGPEFHQVEGDIPFNTRERIVGQGGYRFYGVKRNNSDCDRKIEERLEEIENIFEEDFKYGHEFLQDDVPHIIKFKDMRIGRGGFRFIDVERNEGDLRPKDVIGLDYRTSRASIHPEIEDIEEEEEFPRKRQGKPFKQTVFKKTFRLIKPPSIEDFTHGTVLSFVPEAGSSSKIYEGRSTRPSRIKKTASFEKHILRKSGSDLSERRYEARVSKKDGSPMRDHSADELLRGQELKHQQRKRHTQDDYRGSVSTDSSRERHGEERRERHRFPPEVQNRINEIRNITRDASSEKGTKGWKKHEHHPFDTGKSVTEGYEKYVNERGSEIWIKTEETYTEFHHKKKN
ncbi:uncharacterized protein [Parasteatoda tepidariorum]|uniref:uncharacterized protein n=1 Tax=Parasteatoda tepidariorum TaxID=114398 RepID=UPI0039BD56B5